jgi:hypothetical protein
MEKNYLSVAKKTFLIHLKDIVSLYTPNLLNEYDNFQNILIHKKNISVIQQTILYFINRIRKVISNDDKQFKYIIIIWSKKFKIGFPEDKEILYMILMYLFYQIESSVDFLIEGGKLDVNEKQSKIKELRNDCIEKLSILTKIRLNFDEYEAFCNSNKNISENNDNINKLKEPMKKENKIIKQNEDNMNNIEKEKKLIYKGNNKDNDNNITLEKRIKILEEKCLKFDEMEEEMKILKLEVKNLKENTNYLMSKCIKYEKNSIIRRFFHHLSFVYDLNYSHYNLFNFVKLLKEKENNKDILNLIDKMIEIYYENELDFSFNNYDSQKEEIKDFITEFNNIFNEFNFMPEKSDLMNFNNIQQLKNK